MKFIKTEKAMGCFLALWVALAPVKAWAGCSMLLCGAGGGGTAAVNPAATLQTANSFTGTTATQTLAVSLPGAGVQQFLILGLSGNSLATAITSLSVAPNVGSTVTLAQKVIDGVGRAAIWSGTLGTDANAATSATITITFSSSPGVGTNGALYTVPLANLSSTTPTTNSNTSTTSTTVATTVSTTSGGFIIAAAQNNQASQASQTITGTESLTTDFTTNTPSVSAFAHVNGVATNASSSVNYTVSTSSSNRLVVAAWR